MTTLILAGRPATEEYFEELYQRFAAGRLTHTPLLAFLLLENEVRVNLVDSWDDLKGMADDIQLMGQWRGQWRSNFFQFTAGQYHQFVNAKLQLLKSARNVVKSVGPQGGYRRLSYEYTDDRGVHRHSVAASQYEAALLEDFFLGSGITIVIDKQR